LPSFPRRWTIEGRPKNSSGPRDAEPMSLCLSCTQPFPVYLKTCNLCGAERPVPDRGSPSSVAGDLFELDVAAMQALFKKREAANMSDADFERDMVARNVPPVGRARQLKAHQEAKYRRAVLENLIRWWIGLQPEDRTLAEKQRRFHARFGVDVLTALTLDTRETDALIEKLKKMFIKDLHSCA